MSHQQHKTGSNIMTDRPVAIVTGASRGIGRSVALELASLGYDLVVNRVQDEQPEVLEEAGAFGARCEFIPGSIAEPQTRQQIVELTRTRFGRCDMLVNNAGAGPLKRLDILEATEESFDRVLSINLKGPLLPHAARRQLDGPAAKAASGPVLPHRQHRLDLGLHQLSFAGRVLHQQGGHRDDDQALRRPARRVRHRRLRDQSRASSRRT